MYSVLKLFLLFTAVHGVTCESREAVVYLRSKNINGSVFFTEVDGGVMVTGTVTGLPASKYGFHIHELGDTSTCDAAGAHFNPQGTRHGGPDHDERHAGDLGNIEFVGNGAAEANIQFFDSIISLRGRNNIVGRALVLHEQEDDLGLGGHENSFTTGNAGARVACGVIGVKSPATSWED